MIGQRRIYFVIVLLFILSGLLLMLFWDKGDTVLRLNGIQSFWGDFYFRHVTHLGEWIGGVLVGLILFWFRERRFLLTYLIAILLSSGTAQLLKTQVFAEERRPSVTFEEEIRTVEGVELHRRYSFPSGHTTAAFCAFTFLALSFKARWIQIASAFVACNVGISRMYLGQHYLMDVVAGAVLGAIVATMVYRGLIDSWGKSWAIGRWR